ncbi:hypothetical protein [Sphingopyxis sp.]|jgi:hypothetical protein|uniref:hypothetical protein n=1 Tax=Sphingopyxis sp. TaxID=1908224 RepID=UPI002DE29ED0|nr:hypothetical protein [Sphingopyxis sp.]
MADEIHTTRDPDGTTHTTTVIDREPRRRGGMGLGLIFLAAILIAAFFAFQFLANDKAQSGAITEAAQKVGNAAEDVGDAAQKAVE